MVCFFFFQAEDGIRDYKVTGVQTCALPICPWVEVLRDFHIQRRELRGSVGFEEAAAHIAELAHGDALAIRYGNPQREAAERVVETEFFFCYQLEKDANNERLRIAADAEMISRSE